ncbi:hypothetical protein CBM2600_B10566 [Cupriavidus taiwanensis]|nr:hypothetical protein CBM2600_B10566 [Cupriavidus taiwanensis]
MILPGVHLAFGTHPGQPGQS